MADTDDNSARDPARTGASSESDPEGLPAEPGDSVLAGGQSRNQDDVPVDDSFAEDVSGAQDFSEKALAERTRKAYRRRGATS
jgi:hypothetical protein